MRQALNGVTMKKEDNPANLFEELSKIKNQYDTVSVKVTEEELIATVLEKAPREYSTVLTCEQRMKGAGLALTDLAEAMNQLWRTMNTGNEENDKEMSLMSKEGVTCYKCGKKGHKAFQCGKMGDASEENKRGYKGKTAKYKGTCTTCNRRGHKAENCFQDPKNEGKVPDWYKELQNKKNKSKEETSMPSQDSELSLMAQDHGIPNSISVLQDPNFWIADTGASVDSTRSSEGCVNVSTISGGSGVTGQDGHTSSIVAIADLPGMVCDKNGNQLMKVNMKGVKIVPDSQFNLFSITKRQKQGWKLGGDQDAIWIEKGANRIMFDVKIETNEGVIFAAYIKRNQGEVSCASADLKKMMNVGRAHKLLGHLGEDTTRETAKSLGWMISKGQMKPCKACTVAKAKQKSVAQSSSHVKSTTPGERMFLDLSSVKEDGKKILKHWRLMVDEATGLKFTKFVTTKDGMVEPTLRELQKLRHANKDVKFIWCDNGGENEALKKKSESAEWKLGIKFEFTACDTPQQNYLAEIGFTYIFNRAMAMMNGANIPKEIRLRLYTKAIETATLLDGLTQVEISGKAASRFEHFHGKNPKFVGHLRTWGEAGTVKTKAKRSSKMSDRGTVCLLVGYAVDHDGDCYEMWDPVLGSVHVTRDVVWLKKMYYQEKQGAETLVLEPTSVEVKSVNWNEELEESTGIMAEEAEQEKPTSQGENNGEGVRNMTRYGRQVRKPTLYGFDTGLTMRLTPAEERFYHEMKELQELSLFSTEDYGIEEIVDEGTENGTEELGAVGVGDNFANTQELKVVKFNEAMKSNDKEGWKEAVNTKHDKFTKYKVWEPVNQDDVPKGAKILTTTWAMKKKSNGTLRARLNARGFEQVEGEHYIEDDKSAPVVNEVTVRVVLTLAVMMGWCMKLLDVQGAFLNGRFQRDEVLYVDVPLGFKEFYPKNVLLKLVRTIYGLKQAAMQFWREMRQAFKHMEYDRSQADPCLYYKWINKKLTVWITWVDDCLIAGEEKVVERSKEDMMKLFDCNNIGDLQEYVGCKIEHDRDKKTMKLTQPVMIQSFLDKFDTNTDGMKPRTPAIPGSILTKGDDRSNLTMKEQKKYWSGVGKLLHMMRWTRPDIMNAVRETSKFMTKGTKTHMVAMLRVMKYCVGTATDGLLIQPKGDWDGTRDYQFEVMGKSDSEYSKDESRKSVNGWSTFLNESPVSFRSWMMPIVALSVTKAELFAAILCVQDMMYIMRLLNSMELKVKLPMILYVDNKGAKDLCNNWTVGGRTRHIEVKQYFLRELKEAGIVHVKWKSGADMTSDIFTKNLPSASFEKHKRAFVTVDCCVGNGENVAEN